MKLCGPGVAMNVQENGWVTNEIFCDWLNHFKLNVPGGVSKDHKHLLVLDGHCSHVSVVALDKCLNMGIGRHYNSFTFFTSYATSRHLLLQAFQTISSRG